MEGCGNWRFATRGDGSWRWTAADAEGSQVGSDSAFESVEDCMADAALHGYANYHPTEAAYG